MTSVRSRWNVWLYAPKNQSRSRMIKPPVSKPKSHFRSMSATVVVVAGRRSAVSSFFWSPPPSLNPKNEPRNVLPPDLVMTLITPPVARPYSAGRPPVLTSISSTKSKLSCLPFSARSTPVVFSPSMMYGFRAGRSQYRRSDAIVGCSGRQPRNRIDVALYRQAVVDFGAGRDANAVVVWSMTGEPR